MNAALNALIFSRMKPVEIPQHVEQTTCPHIAYSVIESTGTEAHEILYVRCDRCSAGMVATIRGDHPIEVRPMTAVELSQYGEGARQFTS